jgi:hypothetical protein
MFPKENIIQMDERENDKRCYVVMIKGNMIMPLRIA